MKIKYVDWPVIACCDSKYRSNGSKFGDRSKSFVIVNTVNLGKTASHKMSLVLVNAAISILFNAENPFGINNIRKD